MEKIRNARSVRSFLKSARLTSTDRREDGDFATYKALDKKICYSRGSRISFQPSRFIFCTPSHPNHSLTSNPDLTNVRSLMSTPHPHSTPHQEAETLRSLEVNRRLDISLVPANAVLPATWKRGHASSFLHPLNWSTLQWGDRERPHRSYGRSLWGLGPLLMLGPCRGPRLALFLYCSTIFHNFPSRRFCITSTCTYKGDVCT